LSENDNDLISASDPAWFSIKQKKEKSEKKISYKLYTSIPVKEYNFIQYLFDLAKKLNSLSISTDDKISVKIPYNLL
jgi:hypothetical protein